MTVPDAPGASTDPATPPTPTVAAPAAPAAVVPAPTAAAPAVAGADEAAAALAKATAERDEWKSFARKHERSSEQLQAQLEQQQALLRTLAEKAGVEVDGKPDPAKLAEQLTSAQNAAQDRARELAIFRAAAGANANADLLLDSRQFMAKTASLDTTSTDFADQVKALVAETVAANPTLAATPPPPTVPATAPPVTPVASGANFGGAAGGPRQWTQQDVDRATPDEVAKAISAGLLSDMGVGRRKNAWR